jgi:hypothetical protein
MRDRGEGEGGGGCEQNTLPNSAGKAVKVIRNFRKLTIASRRQST